MNDDRLARLTDKQRECLRMVYAHMSSKEIALQLGIEPGTVDQYIKTAMRILDVGDRRAAAKLLAEYDDRRNPVPPPIRLQDEQSAFLVTRRREPILPLPVEGLRPTRVGWAKRLAWIAAITIGISLSFLALIAAADTLTRLLRS